MDERQEINQKNNPNDHRERLQFIVVISESLVIIKLKVLIMFRGCNRASYIVSDKTQDRLNMPVNTKVESSASKASKSYRN